MDNRTIVSRIDGTVKFIRDIPKISDFGFLSDPFKEDQDINDRKTIALTVRALSREWNIDADLLTSIAKYFISVDESNFFIDTLDSCDWDLDEAWERYCSARDIYEPNPFN
jgi:hypothetical protein